VNFTMRPANQPTATAVATYQKRTDTLGLAHKPTRNVGVGDRKC